MTTITAQDGTGDAFTPNIVEGFDPTADSQNVIHQLIGGGIAVTLVGDQLRKGQFRFIFTTDAAAEAAREILGRPTSFTMSSLERPAVNMSFVRDGMMSPAMKSGMLNVWSFSVGYQEIDV